MGHGIKKLLVEKDVQVEFIDKNPDKTENGQDGQNGPADAVFACIPSTALRAGLESAKPRMGSQTSIILLTKGIEPRTRLMNFEVAREFADILRVAILGGPMLAHEIIQDQPCSAVLAAGNEETKNLVRELLLTRKILLSFSPDLKSVALAGVLKNVYALAIGMADGLGWGFNGKGALIAAAASECRKIFASLGADESVMLGPAGLGDLIATALSPFSHNRQMGERIVRGELFSESEGIAALPSLLAMLGDGAGQLQILSAIKSVILDQESPRAVFETLSFQ